MADVSQAKAVRSKSEEATADLKLKLKELKAEIANLQKINDEDQEEIQRLKGKIVKLESEKEQLLKKQQEEAENKPQALKSPPPVELDEYELDAIHGRKLRKFFSFIFLQLFASGCCFAMFAEVSSRDSKVILQFYAGWVVITCITRFLFNIGNQDTKVFYQKSLATMAADMAASLAEDIAIFVVYLYGSEIFNELRNIQDRPLTFLLRNPIKNISCLIGYFYATTAILPSRLFGVGDDRFLARSFGVILFFIVFAYSVSFLRNNSSDAIQQFLPN